MIDSKGIVRDVMSSVVNFKEHVTFVRKTLEIIEAEEKKVPESKPQAKEETQALTETAVA